jgi:hypothetical protein
MLGARALSMTAAILLVGMVPTAQAATERPTRDVLVVSNNWAGTADVIDPHTFKRLKRLNVIPDRAARVAEISADPTATFYYDSIRTLIGEGHNQYVDDGFTSPDGRVVYFSRPSFADVVAISLRTGRIRWRTHIDGYRADHMALSRDGRRLLVSASTANVIDSVNTRTGRSRRGSHRAILRTRTTSRATGRGSFTPASAPSTPTPTIRPRTPPRGCASSRSSMLGPTGCSNGSTWARS